MKKTPFYACHIEANGKIVDFGGWALPVNYGSQIKEHEIVRQDSGMFDVSQMQIIDISGEDAKAFLRYLMCNDVAKLNKNGSGKALYSAILNEHAGIIDDLIVYLTDTNETSYRIVSNGATSEKDLLWINTQATKYNVTITPRDDLAILAVQGPNAINKVIQANPQLLAQLQQLKPFESFTSDNYFYARTGYTGENGLEIILPQNDAHRLWHELLDVNVTPCGLGARDTLRLEAGMNLYGHDMDENITPIECNMDCVVDLSDKNRDFIGKVKYLELKAKNKNSMQVGIVLTGKGVLREGQKIIVSGQESGVVTSGTFSPTLKTSIAIARVKDFNDEVAVEIRGQQISAKLVKLPFVRNGRIML